jgi:nitric oxide dioxygenase
VRNADIHLWYEEGAQTYEPVNGCHTGMMDLSQVDLPVDATSYRDPAA